MLIMESPPSCSAFILSDDSGLLLTNGSISSGSMSGSGFCHLTLELHDTDKSLSPSDSLDDIPDAMCSENFNTLKKGPVWIDNSTAFTIEPPPEFQDKSPDHLSNPVFERFSYAPPWMQVTVNKIIATVFRDAYRDYYRLTRSERKVGKRSQKHAAARLYCNSDWLPFSPCHSAIARPGSRSSLGSSRLSSSHNSLSATLHKPDDSSFITQAMSHDALTSSQISDLYNVPFDSDIYSVPVDMVRKPKKHRRHVKAKRATTEDRSSQVKAHVIRSERALSNVSHVDAVVMDKRHSVPTSSAFQSEGEPIHMTLHEVRQYLQTLYSSSSDSDTKTKSSKRTNGQLLEESCVRNTDKHKKSTFVISLKNKKLKGNDRKEEAENCDKAEKHKKSPVRNFSAALKQTLCSMFRFHRFISSEHNRGKGESKKDDDELYGENLATRALPPLPNEVVVKVDDGDQNMDFASSIEKVKDYGWYWGPISGEAAEKILSNEPDGSFIVRDSSDDHYIFSLTFKLNNCVRHVRIEHDQGNFSFGSCTKFKSHTIVEFIENAVEHSRSGRYLFFLHRRPILGPMRVQLLHPVSRFKQTQSLQHMCRFVILKLVRRDLIPSLPLPRRIIDYLNTPHYYSEHFQESEEPESNRNEFA